MHIWITRFCIFSEQNHKQFLFPSSPSPSDHMVFPTEAEAYVQELSPFSIIEIGSERWGLRAVASMRGVVGYGCDLGSCNTFYANIWL